MDEIKRLRVREKKYLIENGALRNGTQYYMHEEIHLSISNRDTSHGRGRMLRSYISFAPVY